MMATPELQTHELSDGREVQYAIFEPEVIDNSGDQAPNLLYFLSHAYSLSDIQNFQARFTRDMINPSSRMIVLPNRAIGEKAYQLGFKELVEVRRGNLSPIAERDVSLIRSLESSAAGFMVIGSSFGAARGVAIAKQLETSENIVGGVVLGAPNMVPHADRGMIGLRAVFASQAKHIKPFALDIGTPQEILLEEGLGDGVCQAIKLAINLGLYTLGGNIIPTNASINSFFLKNSFFADLQEAARKHPDSKFVTGTADSDPVCPRDRYEAFGRSADLADNIVVEYYPGNHTTHANPRLIAHLAKKHITLAR